MKNMTEPTIRQATPDDAYAIRKFHGVSWLDTYPNEAAGVSEAWIRDRWQGWDSPEKLQESHDLIASFLADPEQLYRIATVGERVVGLLHAASHSDKQELGALYVDKEYQGSGLAQRLFALADDFWDPQRPVELGVVAYNARAVTFYEKRGFKKVEGSEYLHADVMPAMIMRREAIR